MLKAQNAIKMFKISLIIFVFTSCKPNSQINLENSFLEFYITKNYYSLNTVVLHSDNSNEYILKALKRHSKNKQEKEETFMKEFLTQKKLEKIKNQTVENTKWDKNIGKLIDGIEISVGDTNPIHISKPVFVDKYCFIYSYKKTNDIYFIPTIEVFEIKDKKWNKIGNIKHFK